MQGYKLAEALMANIEDSELLDLINNAKYTTQIIERYRKIIYPK